MKFNNKNKYSSYNSELGTALYQILLNKKKESDEKQLFGEILKNKLLTFKKRETYTRFYGNLKSKIINIFPFKKDDSDLRESIEIRLLDYNYIKNIVKYNPYFGLKIVTDKNLNSCFREKFANFYFKELMRNKTSVLYREILNTQGLSGNRYDISTYNKIIYQVLFKIDRAYDTTVYKPIGDLTIELLEERKKKHKDVFNGYIQKLNEYSSQRLNNPIFMAIYFFDIMIREAIYQKIDWHMWLFYYSSFVKVICENYKIDQDSDPSYEFPNVYSFLLYEIIHNLLSWIKIIKEDTDQVHKELEDLNCTHENANIIKSSIICLKQCIGYILKANEIPNKFKLSILGNVFKVYFVLILHDNQIVNDYGTVLENCLLNLAKDDIMCKFLFSTRLNYIKRVEPYNLPNKPNAFNKLEEAIMKFNTI